VLAVQKERLVNIGSRMDGYAGKTVAELRAISNAKGVFRVKTWRKNQLVNALTKFDKTDPANRRNVYLYKTIEQLHKNAKNKGVHTAKVWPKGKIINRLIAYNKTVKKPNVAVKKPNATLKNPDATVKNSNVAVKIDVGAPTTLEISVRKNMVESKPYVLEIAPLPEGIDIPMMKKMIDEYLKPRLQFYKEANRSLFVEDEFSEWFIEKVTNGKQIGKGSVAMDVKTGNNDGVDVFCIIMNKNESNEKNE